MEFSEGIDVGVVEDFVQIGDIQLPDDDLVQCGSEFCAICNVDTEECLSVVTAGLDSVRGACMIRQCDDVMQRVSSGSVVKVHRTCRRKFCYNRGLKNCTCRLPIVENDCVLVVTCYLCAKVIDTDVNMRTVTTFEIQQTRTCMCSTGA